GHNVLQVRPQGAQKALRALETGYACAAEGDDDAVLALEEEAAAVVQIPDGEERKPWQGGRPVAGVEEVAGEGLRGVGEEADLGEEPGGPRRILGSQGVERARGLEVGVALHGWVQEARAVGASTRVKVEGHDGSPWGEPGGGETP